MGSEWVVIGYAVLGFLSLYLFKTLLGDQENDKSENVDDRKSLDKTKDLFVIGLLILCLGVFVLSMIGLGKGVVESYDYCSVVPANLTETASGNFTTIDYARVCVENSYTEDENLYELTYFLLRALVGLFIVGAIWQIYLFIKDQVWQKVKNKFGKRK